MDPSLPGRVSFFVLFSFLVQSELRSASLWWHSGGLLMQGSVGDLSPSHLILANLIPPRDPRTEGQRRVKQNTSVCLTQVVYRVERRRKSTLLFGTWFCRKMFKLFPPRANFLE